MSTRIKKVNHDQKKIIDTCISQIDNKNGRGSRIGSYSKYILEKQTEYIKKARAGTLDNFEDEKYKKEKSADPPNMEFKEDMIWLYDNKFAKSSSEARKYYDKIMLSADNGRCPYCLHREVSQLDHYLPKSTRPVLSIVTENLIPSCSDCNIPKGTNDSLFSHPYFDDIDCFIYLECDLINTDDGVVFKYKVAETKECDEKLLERIKNQMNSSDLLSLYGRHAASEFNIHKKSFMGLNELGEEKNVLTRHFTSLLESYCDAIGVNSWQSAMYRCLVNNKEKVFAYLKETNR